MKNTVVHVVVSELKSGDWNMWRITCRNNTRNGKIVSKTCQNKGAAIRDTLFTTM